MSTHESPVTPIHHEPEIDDVSTDNPNGAIISSTGNENAVGDEGESKSESIVLSKERKRCFLLSYACFVVMFIAFCFVIALTFPVKPALYVKEIYAPVFDKITPNISAEMKNVMFVTFMFVNRNKFISVSYDNFIYVNIFYDSNTAYITRVHYGDVKFSGFNQNNKGKPLTKVVETPTPGMSSILKITKNPSTVIFRVYIDFIVKFHCRELGKRKHRLVMTADVEVSLESGRSYDGTIEMSETQSWSN